MTKTIVDKLQLHKYNRVAVLNQPEGSTHLEALHRYDTALTGTYDLIFAYVLDIAAMKALVDEVIAEQHLAAGGYLYMAYPKKGNRVYPTYIHRDELFAGIGSDEDGYVGTSSIKFARMVGLDDVFTVVGLKEDAKGKGKAPAPDKPSQRVDDYVAHIPDIERDLADVPDLLAFYQSLTPGCRKDWARHVYSTKQEATREKRREEMKQILQAGYKSRELYRKDQPVT